MFAIGFPVYVIGLGCSVLICEMFQGENQLTDVELHCWVQRCQVQLRSITGQISLILFFEEANSKFNVGMKSRNIFQLFWNIHEQYHI